MLPVFPCPNTAYRLRRNPIFSRYRRVGLLWGVKYYPNRALGELGSLVSAPDIPGEKAQFVSVPHIFGLGNPFKVLGSIIGFIPVFVVCLVARRWRAVKRFGDKPMDIFSFAFRENHRRVASRWARPVEPQYLALEVPDNPVSTNGLSEDGPNPSGVRYFVLPIVSRNRSPTFVFHEGV